MTTELSKRGINQSRLTDKQRLFIQEYYNNGRNGTQAALAAGYSKKTAPVIACHLLQHPLVKKVMGKMEMEIQKEYSGKLGQVIEQLYFCLTRDAREYVDDTGKLRPIKELGNKEAAAIDGFEQVEEVWFDKQGNEHRELKTKVKLVGKASVFDMIMKHKGFYSAEKIDMIQRVVDFSNFYDKAANAEEDDVIEVEANSLEAE